MARRVHYSLLITYIEISYTPVGYQMKTELAALLAGPSLVFPGPDPVQLITPLGQTRQGAAV